MALDFPANPTDGEIYGSYTYSSSKGVWQSREESAAVAVTSPTPPESASNGDIWIDTSDGVAYFYYSDGTSSQWVEIMSSGVTSLASKANINSPTFSGTVTLPSTTSIGNVSSTEIGYVDGVTSAIQTQINSKANIAGQDFTGKVGILGVGSQTTVGAANGTGGLELQSTSTTAASMSFHIPGTVATNIGLNKTDSNFSIGGWSLPVDSLTIDTAGRMRLPYNPLFSGTDTRALVVTNAVLNSSNCYNQIDYNVGNHFNSSTGRFTAPINGYYEASVHIGDASSNSTGTNIRISKNGALNTGPLAEGYNQAYGGAINVFVKSYIYCAAGDYIEFQAAALNTLGGVQHKRFLVRLIQ